MEEQTLRSSEMTEAKQRTGVGRGSDMIVVGTAGYSYEDWIGRVYPSDIDQKDLLTFYAKEFAFTEVNSTFYRMPNRFQLWNMQKKTPDHFKFAIKAYRCLTHERSEVDRWGGQLTEALEPLLEAGKLACVLAQFPTSFHNSKENRQYLAQLRTVLPDIPVVVEFRHRSWTSHEAVFSFLRELDFGFVVVDEPQFDTLLPPIIKVTSTLGYVRFHGRNYAKWWKHEHAWERYNYLYSQEELAEWIGPLQAMEKEAEVVYVAMNNHYQGQAYVNAKQLRAMLAGSGC